MAAKPPQSLLSAGASYAKPGWKVTPGGAQGLPDFAVTPTPDEASSARTSSKRGRPKKPSRDKYIGMLVDYAIQKIGPGTPRDLPIRRGRTDSLMQAADAMEAKSPGTGRDAKLSMIKVSRDGVEGWAYLSVIDVVRDYLHQRNMKLTYDAVRRAHERYQARKKTRTKSKG